MGSNLEADVRVESRHEMARQWLSTAEAVQLIGSSGAIPLEVAAPGTVPRPSVRSTARADADAIECAIARAMNVRHALLVDSGLSANLIAVSTLTSKALGDRRLVPGDEVITVATGFPATVNPIVRNRLVPVFLDVHIPTYNIDVSQLEAALSRRTRAIVVAHTLGNPFDLRTITAFAREYDLFLIEDCCDAVGATYDGRSVGTFGDLATVSFCPAHHRRTAAVGCVLTQRPAFKRLIESFRDWAHDCWCDPDAPVSVSAAPIERLDEFVAGRRRNFAWLRDALDDLQDVLVLPEATPNADPSWFGFPILVRDGAPFTRTELVRHLESRNVATRLSFGSNLVRQSAYAGVPFRNVGDLANSDRVMRSGFCVGVSPGLNEEMLARIAESVRELVASPKVA